MARLRSHLAANFAGVAWTAGLQVLFIPVYLHFLGIEGFALIGFYLMLRGTARVLDLGASSTLNRELARYSQGPDAADESRDLLKSFEALSWCLALVLGLGIASGARFIALRWINAGALAADDIALVVLLMGVAVAIQWPGQTFQAALLGLQQQTLFNVIRIAGATLLHGGGLVVLAWVSPSVVAYFAWVIVAGTFQTMALRLAVWRSLPRTGRAARLTPRLLGTVWRFAAGMTGISLLSLISSQLDKLLLSKRLPLETFGYYTIAGTLAGGLLVVIEPFFNTMFPRLSRLVAADDREALENLYMRAAQLIAVLVLPLASVLVFFSIPIVTLWTRSETIGREAGPAAALLVAGTAINGLMNLPFALQLAKGRTRLAFGLALGVAALYVPALLLLTDLWGLRGAAGAWLLVNAAYMFVGAPLTHWLLIPSALHRWFTRDVGPPLLAALLTSWLISRVHVPPSVPLFAVVAGAFVASLLAASLAASEVRTHIAGALSRLR